MQILGASPTQTLCCGCWKCYCCSLWAEKSSRHDCYSRFAALAPPLRTATNARAVTRAPRVFHSPRPMRTLVDCSSGHLDAFTLRGINKKGERADNDVAGMCQFEKGG